jgi:hypothetical protein
MLKAKKSGSGSGSESESESESKKLKVASKNNFELPDMLQTEDLILEEFYKMENVSGQPFAARLKAITSCMSISSLFCIPNIQNKMGITLDFTLDCKNSKKNAIITSGHNNLCLVSSFLNCCFEQFRCINKQKQDQFVMHIINLIRTTYMGYIKQSKNATLQNLLIELALNTPDLIDSVVRDFNSGNPLKEKHILFLTLMFDVNAFFYNSRLDNSEQNQWVCYDNKLSTRSIFIHNNHHGAGHFSALIHDDKTIWNNNDAELIDYYNRYRNSIECQFSADDIILNTLTGDVYLVIYKLNDGVKNCKDILVSPIREIINENYKTYRTKTYILTQENRSLNLTTTDIKYYWNSYGKSSLLALDIPQYITEYVKLDIQLITIDVKIKLPNIKKNVDMKLITIPDEGTINKSIKEMMTKLNISDFKKSEKPVKLVEIPASPDNLENIPRVPSSSVSDDEVKDDEDMGIKKTNPYYKKQIIDLPDNYKISIKNLELYEIDENIKTFIRELYAPPAVASASAPHKNSPHSELLYNLFPIFE